MMVNIDKKDFYIKERRIVGIFHPSLNIFGRDIENDDQFKVYSNGELIKHRYHSTDSMGGFLVDAAIDKKVHNVQVYYGKKLVYKTHNFLFQRIFLRICKLIKDVFIKIGRGIKTICNEIGLLWEDYHLLIPPRVWAEYFKLAKTKLKKAFVKDHFSPFDTPNYHQWAIANNKPGKTEKLSYQPLISILIPVYNIEREYLSDCLDSILNQTYKNFEVCLADDCSTDPETIKTLKDYEKKDSRIKVIRREENGHISRTTNTAFSISKGEFIGLMDDDDTLTPNALYEMVKVLNADKKLDFIYSDEDKVDMDGNFCEPHFKSDFAPDSLLGGNYICHFEIFRRSLYEKVGGEKHEFVGAQDFDLFLKMTEATDRIYHIPKVLYHWRKVPGSTADTVENKKYAILAGKKAVEDALKRRGLKAKVILPHESTNYLVEYKCASSPKVSIIINANGKSAKHLVRCIKSIQKNTTYKNYDITIISTRKRSGDIFNHKNINYIQCSKKDNINAITNQAIKDSAGKYILFLNEYCTAKTKGWLSSMVGYAMQKHIGCVGCKLLYSDNTIYDGGIVLGSDNFFQKSFKNLPSTDFGLYGRLLTPYNYSAVSCNCLMVSKEKFKQAGGLNQDLGLHCGAINLCLELLKQHYYNVFLPQVEVCYHDSKVRSSYGPCQSHKSYARDIEYLKTAWPEEFKNDPFYNPNFSKKYPFALDK